MDEITKITETTVEAPVEQVSAEPTARQELETLLNEVLPEEKRTGDVEQMALDYIREFREMNNRLIERIGKDPRLAQTFADIMNGKNGAASLARYFGKGYFDFEEGTPEYDEMMAADRAFQDEKIALEQGKADFDAKAKGWFTAFREYCVNINLDADVYLARIMDKVVVPTMDWEVSDEFFDRLVKAVDYEKDTNDAFEAGKIRGRNMNIRDMRMKPTDGMPKALGAQSAPEQPKRRVNSLIAKALNA